MKRYCGDILHSGPYVYVSRDGGKPYPLKHHVRHSPDGFAWGYGGSGPAELARCILFDHFSVTEEIEDHLPVSYQDFKADVIARLPKDEPFEITEAQVEQYVNDVRDGKVMR